MPSNSAKINIFLKNIVEEPTELGIIFIHKVSQRGPNCIEISEIVHCAAFKMHQ